MVVWSKFVKAIVYENGATQPPLVVQVLLIVTVSSIVLSLVAPVVVQVLDTDVIVHVTLVLAYRYPVAVGKVIIITAPDGKIVAV